MCAICAFGVFRVKPVGFRSLAIALQPWGQTMRKPLPSLRAAFENPGLSATGACGFLVECLTPVRMASAPISALALLAFMPPLGALGRAAASGMYPCPSGETGPSLMSDRPSLQFGAPFKLICLIFAAMLPASMWSRMSFEL